VPILSVEIHPSIRPDKMPSVVKTDIINRTIIEGIDLVLSDYRELKFQILSGGKLNPGYLIFSEKTELSSMGLLDIILDNDILVKIVPILHGG
tara:strand:- start:552 stop:830 length:279 start_codon:yes stop_codon:yes gene_type:complete